MTTIRRHGGLSMLCLAVSLLLTAVLLLAGAPRAEAKHLGRCTTVDTPWPIILPDGETYDSGRLTICLSHVLNPVTGLHEIRIGKYSIGRYMSRIGDSEEQVVDSPLFVFHRTRSGKHRLVGYAWPNGESMRTYRLFDLGLSGKEALRVAATPLLDDPGVDEYSVLMAAQSE